MIWLPFRGEIEAAFREDGKLVPKLLAAVLVGLVVGARASWQEGTSLSFCACIITAAIAVSVLAVLGLSLRDVVRRRMSAGQRVSFLLRCYLGSGYLSFVLWMATVMLGLSVASIFW